MQDFLRINTSRWLAITVIFVMALGMFPQQSLACHEPPEPNPDCIQARTKTIGYWKNHPENYVLPQSLSCETVSTSEQAIEILENANAKDMIDMLRAQLLAMKFNVSHFEIGQYDVLGHDTTVNEIVTQAENLLCSNASKQEMSSMKNLLDHLNNHHLVEYCPEPEIPGCTDPDALNYNPDATIDDNSCEYPEPEIPGCMDPEANNYDPEANLDDGSCLYDILGCTDPDALNYDSNANIDDGSCEYPEPEIPGCTDPEALNYNPEANLDDETCEYEEPEPEIPGCMDPEALNYNPDATEDDDSCEYEEPEVILGCTDSEALNYNPEATEDDGTCEYQQNGGGGSLGITGGGSSGKPSLRIKKSIEEEFTNPGGVITFVIEIENTASGRAYRVVLEDILPDGFFYKDTDSSNKKWQIGDIDSWSKRTITYQVEVGQDVEAGIYTNTAELDALNHKRISDSADIDVRQPIVLAEEIIPEPEPKREVLPNTGIDSFAIYLLLGFALLINGLLGIMSIFAKKHKQRIQIALFASLIVAALVALSYPFWPLISYQEPELVLAEENDQLGLGTGSKLESVVKSEVVGDYLIIPKIGVEIPIVPGEDESALDRGAWLMPESSTPDKIGNTILAGHRFKYKPPQKETFYLLDKLSEGDLVRVVWQGKEYRYRVVSSQVVDPETVEVLEQTETPTITLITCHPLFSDKQRLIVKAELI
jgi:LPXTG-site transpeptidase (sortase) family protein